MARVWREGEKARGRWARAHPRGRTGAHGEASGKRLRMAQEHPTEREEDREPWEATRGGARPEGSEAAGAPLEEGSQRGCGAGGRGASRKEEVRERHTHGSHRGEVGRGRHQTCDKGQVWGRRFGGKPQTSVASQEQTAETRKVRLATQGAAGSHGTRKLREQAGAGLGRGTTPKGLGVPGGRQRAQLRLWAAGGTWAA